MKAPETVKVWFAMSSAMEEVYRVREETLYSPTYDTRKKRWDCDCGKGRKGCRHVDIAKIAQREKVSR